MPPLPHQGRTPRLSGDGVGEGVLCALGKWVQGEPNKGKVPRRALETQEWEPHSRAVLLGSLTTALHPGALSQ